MADTAKSLPPEPAAIDQRVFFHGISWPQFEAMLTMRGDHGSIRFTYLEGELELMSPSRYHEMAKTKLARLLEAFAEERGIELEGFGSWTIKNELRERGVEPDECYVIGPVPGEPERPDFAVEVVHTSGGIDKLAVYQGLEVPEVWFFDRGRLEFHRLERSGYVPATHSMFLSDLDPALIVRCMDAGTQTEAVRQLRAALRSHR
jgi:Uma2 family endonuclease